MTQHAWVDGPDGLLYHCRNCGISKVNDYSFYSTCDLWLERQDKLKVRYYDANAETIAQQAAQIDSLRKALARAEQTFRNLETGRAVRAYGEDDSTIYHNELENMRAALKASDAH